MFTLLRTGVVVCDMLEDMDERVDAHEALDPKDFALYISALDPVNGLFNTDSSASSALVGQRAPMPISGAPREITACCEGAVYVEATHGAPAS